jgi:ribosomal protein S27AE
MPKKQKIALDKVLASLGTVCPKCGYSIPPKERRLVDFDHVECPECGERFVPGSGAGHQG